MISRPLTRVVNSTEMFLAPGAVLQAEGQALVRVPGATAAGVQPSSGAAGELFQGFVFIGTSAYPLPEATTNKVETFLVPLTGQVVLAETPLSGQISVFDVTLGHAVTPSGVTGNTVSGLTAGDTVNVTYKYQLSVVQAVALRGDVQPGGYSGAYVNQVGVVTRGFILTDQFDASQDYTQTGTTGKALICGQAGVVTLGAGDGTAGAVVPGTVTRLPDDSYPFLGIEFSANA
jgi:hypothetical protein